MKSNIKLDRAKHFGIRLPNGILFNNDGCGYTRHQVMNFISYMPNGSKIEPPIPPANLMALDLLDFLCK